jgi:hypothetical protein
VNAQADLELAIADYAGIVSEIKDNIWQLKARTELFSQHISSDDAWYAYVDDVNEKIIELEGQIAIFNGIITYIEDIQKCTH